MTKARAIKQCDAVGFGHYRGDGCCKITQSPVRSMDKDKIRSLSNDKRVDALFRSLSRSLPRENRISMPAQRRWARTNIAKTAFVFTRGSDLITNIIYIKRCRLVNFINPVSIEKMRMTAPQILRCAGRIILRKIINRKAYRSPNLYITVVFFF